MANLRFFDHIAYSFVKSITVDLLSLDLTAGLHGSVKGSVSIEVKDDNIDFLKSLKENSHFMTIARDDYSTHGTVIESAVINRNICTVTFIGFYEFLSKIEQVASHKANSIGNVTTVPDNDSSWIKNFYSDSALGLFYALMINLERTMQLRSFKSFFDVSQVKTFISTSTEVNWGKSYRLNSLEFPTVKSSLDKIFEDSEMDAISVTVENSDTFRWVIKVITEHRQMSINTLNAIKGYTVEPSADVSRAFSLASGTNLTDDQVVSRQVFDPDVIYSSHIASNPSDRTTAIDRINSSSRADADKRKDQISFTGFNTAIKLLDAVSISGPLLAERQVIITQIAMQGKNVTYTGQEVTDASEIIKGIRKPNNKASKLIYDPLGYAAETSREIAFKKPGSTGLRS